MTKDGKPRNDKKPARSAVRLQWKRSSEEADEIEEDFENAISHYRSDLDPHARAAPLVKLIGQKNEGGAAAAINEVLLSSVSVKPYYHFLDALGYGGETPYTQKDRDEQECGNLAWEAIARKAAESTVAEGMVMTPILNDVLSFAIEARRMFEEELKEREVEHGPLPLGAPLDDALKRLCDWIHDATTVELKQLDGAGDYADTLIARHSNALADPGACEELIPKIYDRMEIALENPRISNDTRELLVDLALDKLLGDNETSKEQIPFWRALWRHGHTLNPYQIRRIRLMAHAAVERKDDKSGEILETIANIRQACDNAQIRTLLETAVADEDTPNGEEIAVNLLFSSQGVIWAQLLKQVSNLDENSLASDVVERAIKATDDWNLTGVTTDDLLCLIGSDYEEIRATGRKLAVKVEPAGEKAEPAKTAARTRRPP